MNTPVTVDSRMRTLADRLQAEGAITTDAVYDAFASVPRHLCVTWFLQEGKRIEVPQDEPPPSEVLDVIYSDAALPTVRATATQPCSGSSQTSLMARMLETLDVQPGMRVLEIGAGTGYNAALIAAITGSQVVTVEAGAEAATGAQATVARLGLTEQVTVLHRDGYDPGLSGPFDRIIATVGIAGIPPAWLDLLTPDGKILAPIAHGGYHPAMAVTHDGAVTPVIWCDFMPALGPLRPSELFEGCHKPETVLAATPKARVPDVLKPMTEVDYEALWFYLGAHDRRTTRAYTDHPILDPTRGLLALADGADAVWIQHDGSITHTGDSSLLRTARRLLALWAADVPRLLDWRSALRTSNAPAPLLTPGPWARGPQ